MEGKRKKKTRKEMSSISKAIATESKLVAAKNSGMWVEKGVGETANRYAVSFQN